MRLQVGRAGTCGFFCFCLCIISLWIEVITIMRLLKEGGAKGLGKVFSLLLAAFAMMMIRMGIKRVNGPHLQVTAS
jgi:small neutral amino acid transporter SnatA (MarC family)